MERAKRMSSESGVREKIYSIVWGTCNKNEH